MNWSRVSSIPTLQRYWWLFVYYFATGLKFVLASEGFLCYQCASPISNLQNQNLLKQLATILQQRYVDLYQHASPIEDVSCYQPRNHSLLRKTRCQHAQKCYELKADDYQGRPFVMRGCAEDLIPLKGLQAMDKEPCMKPVKSVEIRECFCSEHLCNVAASNASSKHFIISSCELLLYTLLAYACLLWRF